MEVSKAQEIKRLYNLEFGHTTEWFVRLIAAFVGSYILFAATGYWIFFTWFAVYAVFYGLYYLLFRFFMANPIDYALPVLVFVFALLTGLFLILPACLIIDEDQTLQLAGIGFFSATMMYFSRRNDTYKPVVFAQIAMVLSVAIGIVVNVFRDVDGRLEIVAISCGVAIFFFYYIHSLFIARKLRLQNIAILQAASEAHKMAAVGRLAGGVAHDFNNVLAAVLGNLELYDAIEDPNERQKLIEEMKRAANHGATTVSELLIYTRQAPKDIRIQNIGHLLDEVSDFAIRFLPSRVALSQKIEDNRIEIRTDNAQAKRAILNLIRNALDSMEGGGRIMLGSSRTKIKTPKTLVGGQVLPAGDYVTISVKDTGTGIHTDVINQVHEPFFTTKPVGQGTGLGLPAVLGFATEFGQGFAIDSSESGTEVTIYFLEVEKGSALTPITPSDS